MNLPSALSGLIACDPYFRAWQSVSCPWLAPLPLTDYVAMELLVHCAQEMNHLAGILPELCSTFGPRQQA